MKDNDSAGLDGCLVGWNSTMRRCGGLWLAESSDDPVPRPFSHNNKAWPLKTDDLMSRADDGLKTAAAHPATSAPFLSVDRLLRSSILISLNAIVSVPKGNVDLTAIDHFEALDPPSHYGDLSELSKAILSRLGTLIGPGEASMDHHHMP